MEISYPETPLPMKFFREIQILYPREIVELDGILGWMYMMPLYI